MANMSIKEMCDKVKSDWNKYDVWYAFKTVLIYMESASTELRVYHSFNFDNNDVGYIKELDEYINKMLKAINEEKSFTKLLNAYALLNEAHGKICLCPDHVSQRDKETNVEIHNELERLWLTTRRAIENILSGLEYKIREYVEELRTKNR